MEPIQGISERKQTEELIRESESKFRIFAEQSSEGFALIDEEGRVVEWNRSIEQITGIAREEALGEFAWDVQFQLYREERKTPEAYARAKMMIETSLQTGEGPLFNEIVDAEYHHLDGSNRIAQQKFFPIPIGDGYWVGVISTNISETEKIQTEMRKLSRAIDQTDSAIVITDLEGTIEFVNPAFTRISGFSLQEAIGMNPSILNSGETPPEVYKNLWSTITRGDVWEGEFHNRKKNGELYWEYAIISPVKNDDGTVTHFVGVKENITERKLAEDLVKRQILHQHAIAECSQTLMAPVRSEPENQAVITQALDYLCRGTQTSRSYVFRNFLDPQEGDCLGIFAETCAPGIDPALPIPANQKVPWSQLPPDMHRKLQSGNPFGGPTERLFAGSPYLAEFLTQIPPLLSLMLFPIFFEDHWWGFVGFDDCENPREWDESEILLLRTASEMIGNTIQRWEAESALRVSRDNLEQRVFERTADLDEMIETLQKEIVVRQQAETSVERRLHIERKLAAISVDFMEAENLDEILPDLLEDIGGVLEASRVSLNILGQDQRHKIYDWSEGDLPSIQSEFGVSSLLDIPWAGVPLRKNEIVYVCDIEELPPAAKEVRRVFEENKIQSLLLVPIWTDNNLAAILSCGDFIPAEADRSERIDLIKVIVSIMSSMIERELLVDSLEQRVVDQTRELSALYDMTMLASDKISDSEILEPALMRILDLVGCQAVSVHALSEDRVSLELISHRGLGAGADVDLVEDAENFKKWVKGYGEPIIEVLPDQYGSLPSELQLESVNNYMGVLMRVRGRALGILSCYWNSPASLSVSRISLLISMADQIGIIIENQRLRIRAEERAILAERQRLARDLHDSITQSLYSLTLYARSGRDALQDRDEHKLEDILPRLETTAGMVLKEMRLLLYQLRPLALEHGGLQEAIDRRFDQIERRVGIRAEFVCPAGKEFSSQVEETLHFIITEALNNSLKHAHASQVEVKLQEGQETCHIEVTDNGCGFDVTEPRKGMGLMNLEERAREIGGSLDVDSEPGQGTRIMINFPSCEE